MTDNKLQAIFSLVSAELDRAIKKHPPRASFHEAYAILKEEVDEVWDEIKKKEELHDPHRIKEEAVQVAAMAIRLIYDLVELEEGK